ncbi:MAG: molybdopterin-dependent oxidoreductase, partial [Rickettsia sp.]
AAYTEQSGIYVNLEGRPQIAEKAVAPVGTAKEDIEIIKELAGFLKIDIGIGNLQEIRTKLAKEYKIFASIDKITENKFTKFSSKDKLSKESIIAEPINYYMTDVISKNSVTMAKCVEAKQNRNEEAA